MFLNKRIWRFKDCICHVKLLGREVDVQSFVKGWNYVQCLRSSELKFPLKSGVLAISFCFSAYSQETKKGHGQSNVEDWLNSWSYQKWRGTVVSLSSRTWLDKPAYDKYFECCRFGLVINKNKYDLILHAAQIFVQSCSFHESIRQVTTWWMYISVPEQSPAQSP